MFRSRKDSANIISPLDPPPAIPRTREFPNGNANAQANGNTNGSYSKSSPGLDGPAQRGGPLYAAGGAIDRQTSVDTTGSGKAEKRRSGFFGLGKKKEEKKEQPFRVRPNSFSQDRPAASTLPRQSVPNVPSKLQNETSEFQPYAMRQFPPPQNGNTPPPPIPMPVPKEQSRDSPNGLNNGGRYPTSQSMSFASRQGGSPANGDNSHRQSVAEMDRQGPDQTQRQGWPASNQNVPRSASMPFRPEPVNADSYGSQKGQNSSRSENQLTSNGTSERSTPNGTPTIRPEPSAAPQKYLDQFGPVVELIASHASKTYVASPPELEMILARTSAGGQPKQGQPGSVGNDWDGVWLQLSGISLSMWSMKETRIAAAKGDKVPPTYFNITDSSLELLSPLPPPPHRPESHPHRYVFSLNTAGSNRLLFSCPNERVLANWSSGLRLAAWERARLEEIYTGHLIRSEGKEPKTPLAKGRMEGWVRVRLMGLLEWHRLWLVLSTPDNADSGAASKEDEKKNRRRSFFSIGGGEKQHETVIQEPNTGVCMASFYSEPRTVRNKTQPAVLTITDVSQAYAVFPERLEVMTQSNLMKVVGRIGGSLVTIEGRLRDSGWALIMPEAPGDATNASPPPTTPLNNMMRWVVGFHDAFKLYGRPGLYSWSLEDPKALWFAYPKGEDRGRLFIDVEDTLAGDLRAQNLGRIRAEYIALTNRKLQRIKQSRSPVQEEDVPRPQGDYRLPPLSFGEPASATSGPRSLTPISERASRENSTRTNNSSKQYSDRRASETSTKQGSGASNRHQTTVEADRLATISDGAEPASGLFTEEPEEVNKNDKTPHVSPSLENPTPVSRDESTVWSQDSGVTPNRSRQLSPISAQPLGSTAIHALPIIDPSQASDHSDRTTPKPAADKEETLPAPISPPVDEPKEVLAPTPRRVSSGSFDRNSSSGLRDGALHEEPAAMYLMNMVEEPVPATSERVRPTVITSFDNSKSPDNLGRKPSGARAPPPRRSTGSRGLEAIEDDEPHQRVVSTGSHSDLGDDAKTFLEYGHEPAVPPPTQKAEPVIEPQTIPEPPAALASSFTLSKTAVERKARAEQEAEAKRLAMRQPGGGKRTAGQAESSGSEDEEEDSPAEERRALPQVSIRQRSPATVQRSASRALPPVPPVRSSTQDDHRHILPPPPQERAQNRSPAQRTFPTAQSQVQIQGPIRQLPQPNRQSVWNANFDQEHGLDTQRSSKFIELDQPAHMTAAFAPHGLLQAGLQDKEDRSAKRQEELARETGGSLINVPSKPPPPQTGLLGAVAAHERERQGNGGIGATLTDRDRERRLAEERQRKIDDLQREQMEHYAQLGQGDNPYQQNPYRMSMMPGMPGMPPMPYGSWGTQLNPWQQQQAMLAAQMAYQQTLAMMSHSGSQAGDNDRPVSPSGSLNNPQPHPQGSPPPNPHLQPYGYGIPHYPQGMGMPPMPYGYPGMMPWGSSMPPSSPGYGMGMPQPPSFGRVGSGFGYDWQGQQGNGSVFGHGQGQGQGLQTGSPALSEHRSRVASMVSESEVTKQHAS